MTMRSCSSLTAILLACAIVAPALGAHHAPLQSSASDPDLPVILQRTGTYLARYSSDLSQILAEENYEQRSTTAIGVFGRRERRLRSDVLFFLDPKAGWFGFRDVFEADGKPVRDRDARLAALFADSRADAIDQARRIVAEGARFNLDPAGGSVSRTLNMPIVTLKFFLPENQRRSTFAFDGWDTVAGLRAAKVTFTEALLPRMIDSPDNHPARGVAWIDPDTGRVLQTNLAITTGRVSARIDVIYRDEPGVAIWVPQVMREQYQLMGGSRIDGQATYSNFRKFSVGVAVEVEADPGEPGVR